MIQQSHSWAYIQRKLIQKDKCTPVFIAATIHNIQDMGTDEGKEDEVHIYNGILLSH